MGEFSRVGNIPNIFISLYDEAYTASREDMKWEMLCHSETEVCEWYLREHTDFSAEYLDIVDNQRVLEMMERDGFHLDRVSVRILSFQKIDHEKIFYLIFSTNR